MESVNWRIVGARIIDPRQGTDMVGDLTMRDGHIADGSAAERDTREIDGAGLLAMPGLIDLHVHFREPGHEEAETFASGMQAAARGGLTTVLVMPNTTPPVDTPERVAEALRRAEGGPVRVLCAGAMTIGREGKAVADLRGMARAGCAAFSDDGTTPSDEAMMERAMTLARRIGCPMVDHAMDPEAMKTGVMHEGAASARLGLPGMPELAETSFIHRDIRLCEKTGCPIHIQHVSSARGVELIRAAARRGLRVSGEVTPHHLTLTDEDVRADDGTFKMSPPLRTAEDRRALRRAVADGVLRAFATDHAPHPAARKALGMRDAPFGVIGLETAVGVTYTAMVIEEGMSLMEWVRRWTTGPASVLGLPAPGLSPGDPADVALLDLRTEWTVRASDFVSKSRNTPFEGRRLVGRAVMTFRSGRRVWNGPRDAA